MKLKVTYRRHDSSTTDLAVTVDAAATVGSLADALQRRDPAGGGGLHATPSLRVEDGGRTVTLPAAAPVLESGVRSGATVSVVPAEGADAPRAAAGAALVTVFAGPDRGAAFELSAGVNSIGRDPSCDVQLNDPMVSKRHARITVGDVIEIADDASANGVLIGADLVQRAVVRGTDRVTLGDSVIGITSQHVPVVAETPTPTEPFNRSPRVEHRFEGGTFEGPEPPSPPDGHRFPLIMAIIPLLIGGVMLMVTKNAFSLMFMLMSPLMYVGIWFENKYAAKRAFADGVDLFRANLADLVVRLQRSADEEQAARRAEHPATEEVVGAVAGLTPQLWSRRPDLPGFLELRLGLGRQLSRSKVELPSNADGPPELRAELLDVVSRFQWVDHVPVVGSLSTSGAIGVSGTEEVRLAACRALVVQLIGLHSPSEVVLVGLASARTAASWEWLKWLPHTSSDHSPLGSPHLVATEPACANLIAELEELVDERAGGDHAGAPVVVVLVEDDAPALRSDVVELAERGPAVGVHVVWMAMRTARLPAVCRTFLELESEVGGAAIGKVIEAEDVHPVEVELLDAATVDRLARRLAPVVDVNAATTDESDLATSVSYLSEAGMELAEGPEAVLDRWKESGSLHLPGQPRKRMRRESPLRALVGRGVADPFYLDLRSQGPHALVGGTTGAGKSEFLQTWILGMAATYGPQRVTFLFVDYKGGSAFADCVDLPHSVGLVTDLSPHLVRRALTSLNAELRYREHILNRKKAKDLLELEQRGDPDTPPSLVIVVDEFAALVAEVPEFVDGVVNVAQRGRSLGLHLILATQRPAGVIKDNLRANTNLRVALRMADEDDSLDVVGTAQAASFDPGLPGRAIAKTGPGRLTVFQAGYAGGWTSAEPPPPKIELATLTFGGAVRWEDLSSEDDAGLDADPGPTDIQRVVVSAQQAASVAGLEAPRRPWLAELRSCYDLAAIPKPRRDAELTYGVMDDPERQAQPVVAFLPDVDGNMAVFGTGGSGKSTFLRTLAVSAGLTKRGGPCHVYGLDFGARGLHMIDALPHVGSIIGGDDEERVQRLLRQLRSTLDERAERYAGVGAGTIDEYRDLAGRPDEARLLLLVDGMAAFRSAYETGANVRFLDLFQSIAADGRPVGIHVVISADRPSAVSSSLMSAMQQRLVLRLANENDLLTLGVPADGFGEGTPPGRGFLGGNEVQVAVFGGDPNISEQTSALKRLAGSMHRAGTENAPEVGRLPELVDLADLPARADGRLVFGVSDESLAPFGYVPTDPIVISGPPGAGKSTALVTLAEALRRGAGPAECVLLLANRSPIGARDVWAATATGPDDVAELAQSLAKRISTSGVAPAVFVDDLGEFLNSPADLPLQDLCKAVRQAGGVLVGASETSTLSGTWPLLQPFKSARHGIALVPDQLDGDLVFKTAFPRTNRADFPLGRGFYVRTGTLTKVQVARPSSSGGQVGSSPHSPNEEVS